MAVILLGIGISNYFTYLRPVENQAIPEENNLPIYTHPLSGVSFEEPVPDFFAIAIMFDNAYDARPQHGLDQADIVYEALAEGNITRLMGIFDSHRDVDKIGPVRSARPYFMDWAEEYGGMYMHVGGSPTALGMINNYDFVNIDQIGAGEIYFWRDQELLAPHNVFTSSANWLRAGDIKEVKNFYVNQNWNFVDSESNEGFDFSIDYNGPYKVDWQYNDKIQKYLRWQGDDKFIYHTGEQVQADNIVIQVASSRIVDDKERRVMNTKDSDKVFVFNKLGMQEGIWEVVDGRTLWLDENKNELKLVAGKTWVQLVPSEEYLIRE